MILRIKIHLKLALNKLNRQNVMWLLKWRSKWLFLSFPNMQFFTCTKYSLLYISWNYWELFEFRIEGIRKRKSLILKLCLFCFCWPCISYCNFAASRRDKNSQFFHTGNFLIKMEMKLHYAFWKKFIFLEMRRFWGENKPINWLLCVFFAHFY